jgi:hypothetical protein
VVDKISAAENVLTRVLFLKIAYGMGVGFAYGPNDHLSKYLSHAICLPFSQHSHVKKYCHRSDAYCIPVKKGDAYCI